MDGPHRRGVAGRGLTHLHHVVVMSGASSAFMPTTL